MQPLKYSISLLYIRKLTLDSSRFYLASSGSFFTIERYFPSKNLPGRFFKSQIKILWRKEKFLDLNNFAVLLILRSRESHWEFALKMATNTMDAIKKKMQVMKMEKDVALDKSVQLEQKVAEQKSVNEKVGDDHLAL